MTSPAENPALSGGAGPDEARSAARTDVEPGCSTDDLPTPGEIRTINGQRCRFIEREIEGDKWEVLGPAPDAQQGERDEALKWLLRLIVAMGGKADASEYRGSWVNAFCDDGEPDTFNRAIELGLARSSHCTSFDTSTVEITDAGRVYLAASAPPQQGEGDGWRPIEDAPTDGTVIDVWRPGSGRDTVFWGYPHHECGEMGSLCDDDWHRIRAPGWVCNTLGEFLGRKHAPFTHWRRLPSAPPQQGEA